MITMETLMTTIKQLLVSVLMISGFALSACSESETVPVDDADQTFSAAPLINPNDATATQLAGVEGLSDTDVAAILAGRPFAAMSTLHAIIGAGKDDSEITALYGQLFIKVGLNTGSEEDYKLIPSTLSPRHLAHEFEEYRPYSSLDDFAREMKKYVSDAEVENLKRYVTLD